MPGLRVIGMRSNQSVTWSEAPDAHAPLLAALNRKVSRYGEFDIPYIIAVDTLETV